MKNYLLAAIAVLLLLNLLLVGSHTVNAKNAVVAPTIPTVPTIVKTIPITAPTAVQDDIIIDEFDDGAFSTSGSLPGIVCSAIGGERSVFVSDSGGNTTPTVASLVPGNGYMELAVGNSPGTYQVGYGGYLGGPALNLDLSAGSIARIRVDLSQAPISAGVLVVHFESRIEIYEDYGSEQLTVDGPGIYGFDFSSTGFDALDFTDIDTIWLSFTGTTPAFSNFRIESILVGPPNCPSDINGDGHVNVLDLIDFLAAWGACP